VAELALWEAARTGKLDVVRRLILSGEDPDMQTIYNQYTPLILAAKGEHLLCVKYIMDSEADLFMKDTSRLF
jgi:ankyrin repeat protein